MARPARALFVPSTERRSLRAISMEREVRPRVRRRVAIILAAAGGLSNCSIAARLGVSRPTVLFWRKRYAEGGLLAILSDAPRSGRPRRRSRFANARHRGRS